MISPAEPRRYLPCRGQAAARHPDIEQADVGPFTNGSLYRLGGIRRRGADLKPLLALDRAAHVVPGRRVVVSDQHA